MPSEAMTDKERIDLLQKNLRYALSEYHSRWDDTSYKPTWVELAENALRKSEACDD